MDQFSYRSGRLYCEDVAVDDLCARVGTPLYVYSQRTLLEHYQSFRRAFIPLDPLVCFSIKSCANVHLIRLLVDAGSGIDVVSGGEFFRARHAGTPPDKIVAAGAAKTEAELRYLLSARVGWLNVESEQEFEVAARLARELGVEQRCALRVNPNVADARTHAKTTTGQRGSKFGVDLERAEEFFERYGRDAHLRLNGLHVHIGSPIYSAAPYIQAIENVLSLQRGLAARGFSIASLNIGGGFAANYDSTYAEFSAYADPIVEKLTPFVEGGGKILLEPGRTISANTAILATTVQYTKRAGDRNVVLVDAGMNDLIRPSLYDSYHHIWPARVAPELAPVNRAERQPLPGLETYDIAGPICESSDYFARERRIPGVARGDVLAVFSVGAYGMVMASQYNAHPRPAEVLVDGDRAHVIRARESYEDLIEHELERVPISLS